MHILIALLVVVSFGGFSLVANMESVEADEEPPSTQPAVQATAKKKLEPIKPPTGTASEVVAVTVTPTPTPTPKPTPIPDDNYYPAGRGIMGKVSYYSRAGCIGCSPNMITASGEPLDDSKFTLAVVPGQYEMGTMVLVTNLSNGRSAIAKVNDTGGFAKYNRIADLSLALYEYLNAKTDQSIIMIEPVKQ